jgi:hypothetical protein
VQLLSITILIYPLFIGVLNLYSGVGGFNCVYLYTKYSSLVLHGGEVVPWHSGRDSVPLVSAVGVSVVGHGWIMPDNLSLLVPATLNRMGHHSVVRTTRWLSPASFRLLCGTDSLAGAESLPSSPFSAQSGSGGSYWFSGSLRSRDRRGGGGGASSLTPLSLSSATYIATLCSVLVLVLLTLCQYFLNNFCLWGF